MEPASSDVNHPVIPIVRLAPTRQRKRAAPRGRRVDPVALSQVQALLGAESRQSDLLIEHLHRIQDRYGCLSSAHLAALAQEMRLAQTEVYEVASFYHHFDIVKEGQHAPAPLTVRVCDGLSCELAGAGELLERLPALLGRDVRVIAAPCIGRCEQAPAAVVGQNAIPRASVETVAQRSRPSDRARIEDSDFDRYRARRLALLGTVGGQQVSTLTGLEESGLLASAAQASRRRKWRIVAPSRDSLMPSTSPGRARHIQGRVLIERDPHRFLEGMPSPLGRGIEQSTSPGDESTLREMLAAGSQAGATRLYRLFRDDTAPRRRAYIREERRERTIEGKRGSRACVRRMSQRWPSAGRPRHNFETLYWGRELLEKGGLVASHGRTDAKAFDRSVPTGEESA